MATDAWEEGWVQRKVEPLQSRIGTAPSLHILTMPHTLPLLLLFSVTRASWTSALVAEKRGRAGGEADQLKDEILEVWTKSWKSEESHRILRLLLLKLMVTPQMVLRHHLMVKTLADGMEKPRF